MNKNKYNPYENMLAVLDEGGIQAWIKGGRLYNPALSGA